MTCKITRSIIIIIIIGSCVNMGHSWPTISYFYSYSDYNAFSKKIKRAVGFVHCLGVRTTTDYPYFWRCPRPRGKFWTISVSNSDRLRVITGVVVDLRVIWPSGETNVKSSTSIMIRIMYFVMISLWMTPHNTHINHNMHHHPTFAPHLSPIPHLNDHTQLYHMQSLAHTLTFLNDTYLHYQN